MIVDTEAYNIAAQIYSTLIMKSKKSFLKLMLDNLLSIDFVDYFDDVKINNLEFLKNMADELGEVSSFNFDNKKIIMEPLKFLLAIDFYTDSNIIKRAIISQKPLNTEYVNEVLIYPTYNKIIFRKFNSDDSIYPYFKQLIFIDKLSLDLENVNVKNYYLENLDFDNSYKIIFIPYPTNINLKNIYDEAKEDLFFAEARNVDQNDEKFINSVNYAVEKNPKIIISSEMVGSDYIDKHMKNVILNNQNIDAIVCPSYHKIKNNKKINASTILVNTNNRINKFELLKHNPLTNSRGLIKEDINIGEPSFIILHINKIGRIGIFICKDYFSASSQKILDFADIDIIFIMSYTDKYSQFISKMETNASKKRILMLCNSCFCLKHYNLESPLLISYYKRKNENSSLSCHDIVSCNCKLECDNYSFCFFEYDILIKGNNLQFSSINHNCEVI